MRAFAQADRFVSEVEARKLRPAYVFVGDEVFFRKRCREAILKHLVPADCATSASLTSISPTPIWRKSSIAPARLH